MNDIRGQNSYVCNLNPEVNVDDGPCHAGVWCEHRNNGCHYYDQLSIAKSSQLVVTNYSYYLAQSQQPEGLGKAPLLVMDEAHLAFKAIESHLSVYIGRDEVESTGVRLSRRGYDDWTSWKQWAFNAAEVVANVETELKANIKSANDTGNPPPSGELRALKRITSTVRKLRSIHGAIGRWTWEPKYTGFAFTPVWPGVYAPLLYQDSGKILLMSAIITPKTADLLGVPESERQWLEVPSYYPPRNTPVQHIKTVRLDHRATDADRRQWVARIDQIMDRRMDRKGILFPVSYERRNFFMAYSRHQGYLHSHDQDNVVEMVNKFRHAPAPALLVSPAVTSGWDFPGAECEYIIVGKIPFADGRSPVTKARTEDDPEFGGFDAMQTLVQEAGRGTRSASDHCEVLIVDDHWGWFWNRNSQFAPQWFRDRLLRRTDVVPDPPQRSEYPPINQLPPDTNKGVIVVPIDLPPR